MTKPILISVIMTCHNQQNFVGEAIESILNQTFHDFELIIVDYGSNDKSIQIIEVFQDSRIKLIKINNYGLGYAINTGIKNSQGEYIALMNSNDIANLNRLATQIKQIDIHELDMVFSLPEIIGINSQRLSWDNGHWFYGKNNSTTAMIYRNLFFFSNYLCTSSCFFQRSIIEEIGIFNQGYQFFPEFEYWIRVCKKNLNIKIFTEPLVQFRYLQQNKNNSSRLMNDTEKIEIQNIYLEFFNNCSNDFLMEAFKDEIPQDFNKQYYSLDILKWNLLTSHPNKFVRDCAGNILIKILSNEEAFNFLSQNDNEFIEKELFSKNTKNKLNPNGGLNKLLQNFLNYPVKISLSEEITDQRLRKFIEEGNEREALAIIRGNQFLHPEASIKKTLSKVAYKIKNKLVTTGHKIKGYAKNRSLSNWTLKIYPLERMYDYCVENNKLYYEGESEKVFLPKPVLIGDHNFELQEGHAYCPKPYISILEKVNITGGSGLVITEDNTLLNDEMVDFQGKEFGIKSPFVKYLYNNKAILGYLKGPKKRIKEGIIISCDHDFNYFHWMIECLPKLFFVDTYNEFHNIPILIPTNLHKNLENALIKCNINNHPIYRIYNGYAYQVDRLIFPSALSIIVDRYKGKLEFNKDIVLSHSWIKKVANQLTSFRKSNIKPWRKIFLTRRFGLRSIENIRELEELMIELKFEIIDLDSVSVDFQIELFSQASVIVSPTGAALTNMLLCNPQTVVYIFMSNHEISNYYFWTQVAEIAGLKVKLFTCDRLYNITNYYSVHDDYKVDLNIIKNEIINST